VCKRESEWDMCEKRYRERTEREWVKEKDKEREEGRQGGRKREREGEEWYRDFSRERNVFKRERESVCEWVRERERDVCKIGRHYAIAFPKWNWRILEHLQWKFGMCDPAPSGPCRSPNRLSGFRTVAPNKKGVVGPYQGSSTFLTNNTLLIRKWIEFEWNVLIDLTMFEMIDGFRRPIFVAN